MEQKKEVKTVREWLNQLDEPYRTQAINNMEKLNFNFSAISLSGALKMAFVWNNTPEPKGYWSDLHDELLKQNK